MRLLAIPYSTNVERVLLALALKGQDVTVEYVDPGDRTRVRDVSGQDLVPVLLDSERVIHDSPVILRYLEERFPNPSLYPTDERGRAETDVFVDWFNLVWKRPPNAIAALRDAGDGADAEVAVHGRWLAASVDLFEALLEGRDFLMDTTVTLADVTAFPFLKYALTAPAADDSDTLHHVLHEYLRLDSRHRRLRAWIARMDALPRAGRAP